MKFKPDNPMRGKIIFFEGLDKCGKTTLCRRARFESGHEVLMVDRGFIGRRVFCEFRNEKNFPIKDWNWLEQFLAQFNTYGVIYLDISPNESFSRQVKAGENPEFTLDELKVQQKLYFKSLEKMEKANPPYTLLRVDTEHQTEDDSLREILTWIKGGKEWI